MPPPKRLLLVGAGHAHAFVLEAFAQRPDPTISLTVVSDSPLAAYSGGVPAWLAGECTLRDTQLDIAALCQRAGARLITSPAVALCPTKRQVTLADGHVEAFDVASLNVGATLQQPQHAENAERRLPALLTMRPLGSLHHRWQALLEDIDQLPPGTRQNVVSVGGGAAGCETLMSVLAQLRQRRPDVAWKGAIISASPSLLPGAGWLPRRLVLRALHRADIAVHVGLRGSALVAGGVHTQAGQRIDADIVLWATGAVGQPWLEKTALPRNERGFISVDTTLEVTGLSGIFAAGDCAALAQHTPPLPKAGVYAVRMGPVLADNLRAACYGAPLATWKPPRHVLALIGTGDGRAIASRGAIGFSGRWVWKWKKRIDARFIARFNPPFTH
ncbi:FAD-dependent oxidoreductase [Vreelandella stevensii]|uniref:FAD-dependent oxidoreductase n=1 Tax=Vreelandella stevensii TaxID=502821 RepID=UPI003748C656